MRRSARDAADDHFARRSSRASEILRRRRAAIARSRATGAPQIALIAIICARARSPLVARRRRAFAARKRTKISGASLATYNQLHFVDQRLVLKPHNCGDLKLRRAFYRRRAQKSSCGRGDRRFKVRAHPTSVADAAAAIDQRGARRVARLLSRRRASALKTRILRPFDSLV